MFLIYWFIGPIPISPLRSKSWTLVNLTDVTCLSARGCKASKWSKPEWTALCHVFKKNNKRCWESERKGLKKQQSARVLDESKVGQPKALADLAGTPRPWVWTLGLDHCDSFLLLKAAKRLWGKFSIYAGWQTAFWQINAEIMSTIMKPKSIKSKFISVGFWFFLNTGHVTYTADMYVCMYAVTLRSLLFSDSISLEKVVPIKTGHSTVCGLPTVTWTLFSGKMLLLKCHFSNLCASQMKFHSTSSQWKPGQVKQKHDKTMGVDK